MLLVKEVTTSTYRHDSDGNMLHKFIEEVKQYHYKNKEATILSNKSRDDYVLKYNVW